MPTVLKSKSLKFKINPKEQGHKGRPHCHVEGPGAECSIDLETLEVLVNSGFSQKAVNAIQKEVAENLDILLEAWNEYHE